MFFGTTKVQKIHETTKYNDNKINRVVIVVVNYILKFRKCYAAPLNLTFRFISLTMSSSSSMMALRTSGA